MTEALNQIHSQEYHESLCRDKCSEFYTTMFLLQLFPSMDLMELHSHVLIPILSESWSGAAAVSPVALSGGRSGTLTWLFIFQIHTDTYRDTYSKLKGISEILPTKMHCITEHPLHALNSNLWINIQGWTLVWIHNHNIHAHTLHPLKE